MEQNSNKEELLKCAEELDGISHGYVRQVVARSIKSTEFVPGKTWIYCSWPGMSSLSANVPTADAPALINRLVSLATHVMTSTLVHLERQLENQLNDSRRMSPEDSVRLALVSMLRGGFDKSVLEATKPTADPSSVWQRANTNFKVSNCDVSCVECESKHSCFREDAGVRSVEQARTVKYRYGVGEPVETFLGVKGTVIANMTTRDGSKHFLVDAANKGTFWALESTLCDHTEAH